jgi:hypothetical protein
MTSAGRYVSSRNPTPVPTIVTGTRTMRPSTIRFRFDPTVAFGFVQMQVAYRALGLTLLSAFLRDSAAADGGEGVVNTRTEDSVLSVL